MLFNWWPVMITSTVQQRVQQQQHQHRPQPSLHGRSERDQQQQLAEYRHGEITDSAAVAVLARSFLVQFLVLVSLLARLAEFVCERAICFVFGSARHAILSTRSMSFFALIGK